MPQDRVDFQSRIHIASPKDTVKGSFLNGMCLTLEKLLPGDPKQKELVRRFRKPLWMEFMDHPVTEFLTLTYEGAELIESLFSTPPEAMHALGRGAGRNFLESVVGRIAVRLASGKDPVDILAYGPATYAPGASYGKRWFTAKQHHAGHVSYAKRLHASRLSSGGSARRRRHQWPYGLH